LAPFGSGGSTNIPANIINYNATAPTTAPPVQQQPQPTQQPAQGLFNLIYDDENVSMEEKRAEFHRSQVGSVSESAQTSETAANEENGSAV
jgi:hypothetical protein